MLKYIMDFFLNDKNLPQYLFFLVWQTLANPGAAQKHYHLYKDFILNKG